ncbi:MAG: DUF2853 family protein [Litorimonas sp.]
MSCFIACLIAGTIGWFIGWFMKPSRKQAGDLSMEGEGALRAETDSLRARVQELQSHIAARDAENSDLTAKMASMEASASAPADAAPAEGATDVTAKTTDSDETYALEWQNRYLAARVKYLDSRLAELSEDSTAGGDSATAASAAAATLTDKPATSAKKPATKKPAAKKAPTKKKAAAKSKSSAAKTKAVAAPKATAVTKAAPKAVPAKTAAAGGKSKEEQALDKYHEKVKAFDARASRKVVANIVDYCGVSLKSRDASLVACSDEAELQRVANGFVTKKLGLETGQMDLVKDVCQQMKGTRLKSRVTFYYLAAKKAKKLSLFR